MSNQKITDLTNYTTPDATNDVIPIVDITNTQTKKITRNNYLGITGSPVGNSDSQTLTNKTLGVTNTVTLKDTLFTLQDDGDLTKQIQFQLSGITTGNTRTLTIPDASTTLVGTGTTQTLTNKTLTSPTITGGSIDNTTITVDTVAGHTASTTGTIYGMSVTAGILASAALVGAVTGTSLSTSAITLGYAQITTNFATASTTVVQVTGLTIAVTIPTGSRRIKVTVGGDSFYNTSSGAGVVVSLWDGIVVSGTLLQTSTYATAAASQQTPLILIFSNVPASGSKTYNVGIKATAGTATIAATSTNPAFILVEAI